MFKMIFPDIRMFQCKLVTSAFVVRGSEVNVKVHVAAAGDFVLKFRGLGIANASSTRISCTSGS